MLRNLFCISCSFVFLLVVAMPVNAEQVSQDQARKTEDIQWVEPDIALTPEAIQEKQAAEKAVRAEARQAAIKELPKKYQTAGDSQTYPRLQSIQDAGVIRQDLTELQQRLQAAIGGYEQLADDATTPAIRHQRRAELVKVEREAVTTIGRARVALIQFQDRLGPSHETVKQLETLINKTRSLRQQARSLLVS